MKQDIFDKYAKAIAKKFDISLEDMFTKDNHPHVVDARYMLYYLCIERPIKISYIQKFLKNSGYTTYHSTIRYGYNKAKKIIESDSDYKQLINEVIKE